MRDRDKGREGERENGKCRVTDSSGVRESDRVRDVYI
jgi:hypothetical protein